MAKIDTVIWYCGKAWCVDSIGSTTLKLTGSSRGRGTRAAGWFLDLINEKGHKSMKSLVLSGGIAGWAMAGKEYTDLMDGYEKEVWEKK